MLADNLESIRFPYDDANLRFWRNTSVANLQPGQTATLTKNYLGYEWDEAPDNGFDPAGLVRLSSTTLDVGHLAICSTTATRPVDGVGTHNLTLYRAPSGALVFGAGHRLLVLGPERQSRPGQYPRRRDDASDPRVQQAMVNLFADMGIQPATLQSGLITGSPSTDDTAPTSDDQCATIICQRRDHRHDFRHRHGFWRRRDRRRRSHHRQRCELASRHWR